MDTSDFGGKTVEFGVTIDYETKLSFAEEVEVTGLHEIVTEIRSNAKAKLFGNQPVLSLVKSGGVGTGAGENSVELLGVVVTEVKRETDLHVVTQHVAKRGAKVDGGVDVGRQGSLGSDTGSGVLAPGATAVGLETKRTADHKLCIGCKCESSECEG